LHSAFDSQAAWQAACVAAFPDVKVLTPAADASWLNLGAPPIQYLSMPFCDSSILNTCHPRASVGGFVARSVGFVVGCVVGEFVGGFVVGGVGGFVVGWVVGEFVGAIVVGWVVGCGVGPSTFVQM
jgi:hypothetical protein